MLRLATGGLARENRLALRFSATEMREDDVELLLGLLLIYGIIAVTAGIVASNKGRSAVGWFFLCFLLTPLAIIPLLVLGPGRPPIACPNCGAENSGDRVRCRMSHCREILPQRLEAPRVVTYEADTKICPRCAETVKAAAKICRFCGHEFESEKLGLARERIESGI